VPCSRSWLAAICTLRTCWSSATTSSRPAPQGGEVAERRRRHERVAAEHAVRFSSARGRAPPTYARGGELCRTA
jgi:hypothetical protein